MVTEAEAFCLSCGVARNHGSKCDYCGRLYLDVAKGAKAKPAPLRSLPEKYDIKKTGDEIIISWKWKRRSTWFLIVFALIWIGMALVTMDGATILTDPLAAFPVPILPVLVGLALLCKAVLQMTNGTSIHASKHALYTRHYPIRSRRSIKYSKNDIEQIYVIRVQRSNEHRTWHAPILQIATKSGERRALLSGYNESQFPAFETLRLEILKALDIEAIDVAGAHNA